MLPRVVYPEGGKGHELEGDADVAVRRPRETPEGCAALIREWEHLRAPPIGPKHHRDGDDEARATALPGHASVTRRAAPAVLYLPTRWIVDHREAGFRIGEDRRGGKGAHPRARYSNEDQRKRGEWMIENLREGAKSGVARLSAVIEGQIKDLGELKARLEEEDAVDLERASLRARADHERGGPAAPSRPGGGGAGFPQAGRRDGRPGRPGGRCDARGICRIS